MYLTNRQGAGREPHAATSQSNDVRAALDRLKTSLPSKLESDAAESALIEVLRGSSFHQKIEGRLVIWSHHTPDESVVFIYDPTARLNSKYIIASPPGGGRSFVVSMPIDWTPMHRDILTRIEAATGIPHGCCGGGYVELQEGDREIKLLVGGESGDFGPGDHDRAYAAFQRAAESSPGPWVQDPDDHGDLDTSGLKVDL
jgi:hypothetical protein